MFSWLYKKKEIPEIQDYPPQVPKEISLAERLSMETKKKRAEVCLSFNKVLEVSKKVCEEHLMHHTTVSINSTCTINFDKKDFTEKISGYEYLSPDEKYKIATEVNAYFVKGGLTVFQAGNILTVKWDVVPDSQ